VLLLILLLIPIAYAQECDYYEYENYTTEETNYYIENRLIEGNVSITDTQISGDNVYFKIYNSFNFEVEAMVSYQLRSKWFGNKNKKTTGIIPPKEYVTLKGYYHNDRRVKLKDVKLSIINPAELDERLEKVIKQNKTCMTCTSKEIFCEKLNKCIKKNTVPLNVKPQCNLDLECTSNYINQETGLCEKSEEQKEKEKREQEERERKEEREKLIEKQEHKERVMKYGIIIIIILIIGIWIYFHFRNKKIQEERKKIEKEIKKIEAEMKKEKHNIKQKYIKIRELKSISHKTEKENKRIKKLTKEYEEQIKKLENASKERYKIEYENRFHKRIKIDNNGYFRFIDSNKLLHKWVYETRYSDIPENKQIHHIDANHFNNEIWNLIALPWNLHKHKLKHGKIIYGDWDSGIKELKRIGLSEEDFPEEVLKKLKKN